jgi:hypothetical protein
LTTFDGYLNRFLIVGSCCLSLPIQPAHAEFASSFSVTAANQAESTLQKLQRHLTREHVRAGLEQVGVNPAVARARVDALSDEQLAAIAGSIGSPPADGEYVGALLFIFVLPLIIGILGLTKVSSYTRSVKQ